MKHLKLFLGITLGITVIAVAIASYNLFTLYRHEKEQALATVRECAENALILEMVSRMKGSQEAQQSFIRLNTYIESAQQKHCSTAMSDTLRITLMGILRAGLDFPDRHEQPDSMRLRRFFLAELNRNGLHPEVAIIGKRLDPSSATRSLWHTEYPLYPASDSIYEIYVSPLYGIALSRLWGIIIPFIILICAFTFLAIYLTAIIRRLRTLEEMKDDFTHNMTHELKTPVAVAYSAADSMLRYYDQSDEVRNRQFLKIILQRLSFLSGMIENILSMSMERRKTMRLNIEEVVLRPIAEEVAGMMELKAGKPVEIDVDIADTVSVHADPLHLGNILSNLIDNAVKYSGDWVRISIHADAHAMTITDNGIGIRKEHLPFIFDKFYRVTSGDRYEVGGYGLGLYYVSHVAGLMDWSIGVTSREGVGTTFTIKFNGNEKTQSAVSGG